MTPLEPQYKRDFSGGQANDLNPNITPESTVDLMLNMDADEEIGSAVSRLGTAIIGAQLVNDVSVLGLFQHVDQADTTKNKLFATLNDGTSPTNADIYDVTAGTKSLEDDTHSLRTRFLNFAGDTLRLNGTDAPKAYNSSSWITSGGVFDLANMPTGYKFADTFLSRVYLWGKASAPYTLAYSGVLTSGAVSWLTGAGTVEIEPQDNGGEPTGVGRVPGYLLIFKRRSMHRWNFQSAFPEELVNIGAYSQESIVSDGGYCAFYSDSRDNTKGFYITNGGRPVPISHDNTRPIKKWVAAIATTATVAGYPTTTGFAWSVGDCTVDGVTYTNVVLRYNRILNQWSVRSYPSSFKAFCSYVASGVHTVAAGDNDGTVFHIDKPGSYTDNGTVIRWKLRDQHQDFGFNQLKTVGDQAIVRGKGIEGLTISVVLDEGDREASLQPASLFHRLLATLGIGSEITATTVALELTGETKSERAYVREIELPKVSVLTSYTQ